MDRLSAEASRFDSQQEESANRAIHEKLQQFLQDQIVDTIDFQKEGKPIHRNQHIVAGSAYDLAANIFNFLEG